MKNEEWKTRFFILHLIMRSQLFEQILCELMQ